jgi:hypothetical protein
VCCADGKFREDVTVDASSRAGEVMGDWNGGESSRAKRKGDSGVEEGKGRLSAGGRRQPRNDVVGGWQSVGRGRVLIDASSGDPRNKRQRPRWPCSVPYLVTLC